MVIPTPAQPKLHEMPRDFFKSLAIFSILKKREFPQSKLMPIERSARGAALGAQLRRQAGNKPGARRFRPAAAGDQGAGGGRGRLARLQDHRGGPSRRSVPVAQGQQVQLLRR